MEIIDQRGATKQSEIVELKLLSRYTRAHQLERGELRGQIRFCLLYSSEHEISGASYFWLVVSARGLDGQLQDVQPAFEPVDGGVSARRRRHLRHAVSHSRGLVGIARIVDPHSGVEESAEHAVKYKDPEDDFEERFDRIITDARR